MPLNDGKPTWLEAYFVHGTAEEWDVVRYSTLLAHEAL